MINYILILKQCIFSIEKSFDVDTCSKLFIKLLFSVSAFTIKSNLRDIWGYVTKELV